MLCFRDTTFCASPNCRNECGRQFTSQDEIDAKRWWAGMKGEPPVAFGFFCDETGEAKHKREPANHAR